MVRKVKKFDRETVRAVLDLLSIEGAGFKQKGDYCWIEATLGMGKGPVERFEGEPITGEFWNPKIDAFETRASGYYRVSDAAVDDVIASLRRK